MKIIKIKSCRECPYSDPLDELKQDETSWTCGRVGPSLELIPDPNTIPEWCPLKEGEENLYKKAIEKWGKDAQVMMAIEEMAELMKVLCHLQRKNKSVTKGEIVEEIVDVEIMIEQMKILFVDDDVTRFYHGTREEKLKRLKEMLEGGGR